MPRLNPPIEQSVVGLESMKTCSKCLAIKSISDFYPHNRKNREGVIKPGTDGSCKMCVRASVKKWATDNAEKARAYRAEYYKRDPEGRKKVSTDYYKKRVAADPNYGRNQKLKRAYGITHDDYEQMLSMQSGGCAICNRTNNNRKTSRLHVDHNHETGQVRGLLCSDCNLFLGNARENIEVLQSAITYLTTHSMQTTGEPT